MKSLTCLVFLTLLALPGSSARKVKHPRRSAGARLSILEFGAKGNGEHDDSQALLKAWEAACGVEGNVTVTIPHGKAFRMQPVSLKGPCKAASIYVKLDGNLVAPNDRHDWEWQSNDKEGWIEFRNVDNLVVHGVGQLDGKGSSWWNSCKKRCERPTVLKFSNCPNLYLDGLKSINSPRNHISISDSDGILVSNLHLVAPGESPNTDGIDLSSSSNVTITESIIETGDDCIALNNGTSHVNITRITCGPGHGISVGSLGRDGEYNVVENVYVGNCNFTKTQNGARIKTWKHGSGYARHIRFEYIQLHEVHNPVIINQNYVDRNHFHILKIQQAVKVSDVTFQHIRGTSADEKGIQLHCDKGVGCSDIKVYDVEITSAVAGKKVQALCENAHGIASFTTPRVACLS